MKLTIDTTQPNTIHLKLDESEKRIPFDSPRDQDLLKEIDLFLEEIHKALSDLTEIEVKTGPGGFTSLRTGIATAQSLALALNIPINGQPPGSSIEAEYGREPNISTPKAGI